MRLHTALLIPAALTLARSGKRKFAELIHTALLLSAALSLLACGPAQERAELVFIQSAEPETIDPAVVSDQVSMRISSSLFEGLCRFNVDGRPEPGMAERWEASADGKSYLFHLREGTHWTDGEPVTAHDFAQAWTRALKPETGSDYTSLLHVIRGGKAFTEGTNTDPASLGIQVIDAKTLRVELENPTPYFLDLCAIQTFAPVPMRTLEKHGTAWIKPAHIITNGAYLLEQWHIDDHIRLRKNPRYWDAAHVKMATVEVKPVQDANTALNFFHTGQCDLDKGMMPPTLIDELKRQPWFHTGPFLGTWFIRINTQKKPFDDVRVRQAFALALDKRRIVESITKLGERPAYAITPPGVGAGYQPPAGLEFDTEKARELLAAAGFPGGKGFPLIEYLYIPLPIERSIAIELQAMWQRHLGITVNLQKQEQKIWLSSMRNLDYHLCRSSWVGDYNDATTFLDMFLAESGNNRTGWKSSTYDGLLAQAAKEAETTRRHALFEQAESLLIREQSVVLPVYWYVGVQFFHHRLTGVKSNLIDDHPFRCMAWE
jgi:oligopeptide transport system substrate-binding protein